MVNTNIFFKSGRWQSKVAWHLVRIYTVMHVCKCSTYNAMFFNSSTKHFLCWYIFQVSPKSGEYFEPVLNRNSDCSHIPIPLALFHGFVLSFERWKKPRSDRVGLVSIDITTWEAVPFFHQVWKISKVMCRVFYLPLGRTFVQSVHLEALWTGTLHHDDACGHCKQPSVYCSCCAELGLFFQPLVCKFCAMFHPVIQSNVWLRVCFFLLWLPCTNVSVAPQALCQILRVYFHFRQSWRKCKPI